jgi:predicted site-specific integrase-resolvase
MRVGCYVRVSTADQNLDRQLTPTSEYAQDELGADLAEIETYRDKSTRTNTERSGYRNLMADVDAGDLDAVVVHDTRGLLARCKTSTEPLSGSPRTGRNCTSSGTTCRRSPARMTRWPA